MALIELEIPEYPEIPHGHGLSFKKGIAAGLLKAVEDTEVPNGHEKSYRRGKVVGEKVLAEVGQRVM